MKSKDIAELLDEPACAHNNKSKSGCSKPKPGAAAGGCSFDGAQIALLPIADVAHIVHGLIACAGSSWDNRGTRSSGPTLYRLGMTIDLTEQDVIMGCGEKRLFHSIKQAVEDHTPAAVFVYNTCVPALIGDDIEAVCKAAEARWHVPVVPVDAAGFYGTKNLGNRIAGEAMVKYVIGSKEPEPLSPVMLETSREQGIKVHDAKMIEEGSPKALLQTVRDYNADMLISRGRKVNGRDESCRECGAPASCTTDNRKHKGEFAKAAVSQGTLSKIAGD